MRKRGFGSVSFFNLKYVKISYESINCAEESIFPFQRNCIRIQILRHQLNEKMRVFSVGSHLKYVPELRVC